MLDLISLLLLIAVAFGWSFFIGLTEKKTGKRSILGWPFVLTYWYGKGKPKPETETKTIDPHAQPEFEAFTKNIENLNNSIQLLIKRIEERQFVSKKVKEPEKTNQGE